MTAPPADTVGWAVLSRTGNYRYRLSRTWDLDGPVLTWVMLNPSTADARTDDATIRKITRFTRRWGYGSLVVVNLFALRARDPAELDNHPDPSGPHNWQHLARVTGPVIVAWGSSIPRQYAGDGGIADRVSGLLTARGCQLHALHINADGNPKHPLYVREDDTPVPYRGALLERRARQ